MTQCAKIIVGFMANVGNVFLSNVNKRFFLIFSTSFTFLTFFFIFISTFITSMVGSSLNSPCAAGLAFSSLDGTALSYLWSYFSRAACMLTCPVDTGLDQPPSIPSWHHRRCALPQSQGSQQSWNSWICKVVLKLSWNLKLSFSADVLILTIVVRAQWQFNVLLAALLVCLLHTWIQF